MEGRHDFVIPEDGTMAYGSGHVALSEGRPVVWAGDIEFRNGTIVEWSNASGHFRPDRSFGINAGLPMDVYRGVTFPMFAGTPQFPIYR